MGGDGETAAMAQVVLEKVSKVYPGGVKAVGEWFPMRDRALAIGIFNAGTAVGSVAAAPIR